MVLNSFFLGVNNMGDRLDILVSYKRMSCDQHILDPVIIEEEQEREKQDERRRYERKQVPLYAPEPSRENDNESEEQEEKEYAPITIIEF